MAETTLSKASDETLLLLEREGQPLARATLHIRYWRKKDALLRMASATIFPQLSHMDRESVYSETLDHAVMRYGFGPVRFETYFIRCLHNEMVGAVERVNEYREYGVFSLDEEVPNLDKESTFHDIVEDGETVNDPRAYVNYLEAIGRLEEAFREVGTDAFRIALKHGEGKSFRAIASEEGMSVRQVRYRYGALMSYLKRKVHLVVLDS